MIGHFGLGLGGKQKKVSTTFDPANLALTGWWRASYAGSPWSGTSSAGSSGSNSASEATNPATVGASLNGYDTASFDASNDRLILGGTADTYYSLTRYSGWALIKPGALVGNFGTGFTYLNDSLLATVANAYWTLNLRTDGSATIRHYDGGAPEATIGAGSLVAGAWALLWWRYDGSTAYLGVNNSTPGSVAAGTLIDITQALHLGQSDYAGTLYNGLIAEIGLTDIDLGESTLKTDLRGYVNNRYALSL